MIRVLVGLVCVSGSASVWGSCVVAPAAGPVDECPARSSCAPISAAAGVESWWHPSGVRVHVRPMLDAKRVSIALVIAGGAVLEHRDQRGLTEAVAWSWARPDALPGDAPDDRDAATPPAAAPSGPPRRSLRVEGCPEGVQIRANLPPDRLPAALTAIGSMLREPRCDPERLRRWRERALKAHEVRSGSVEHQVAAAIMDALVPDEVPGEGKPLSADAIEAISAERAHDWLLTRIVTSPMELAVAGPVEIDGPAGVRAQIDAALDGLPQRPRISALTYADRRVAHRVVGPTRQRVSLPIPPGTAHVIVGFSGPDLGAIDDLRALNLAAEVAKRRLDGLCNDGRLDASMCAVRLMPARMHPGLGAMFITTRVPDAEPPVAAALEAIERLLAELVDRGPAPDELAQAGSSLADDARRRLAEPDYWAACLAISTLQNLSVEALQQAPDAYATMPPQRVREVIGTWCVPANRFSVVIRPAPAAPAAPAER